MRRFTEARDDSTGTVERPGGTSIHYTVSGPATGRTWVFVHGWGCRRTDFAPLAAFLPATDRVLTVDLAGHGDSPTERELWTMAEFARDVEAVNDALGVEQCVVAGHSMGGAVAVELARLRPEMVTQVLGLESYHYLSLYPAADEAAARALLEGFETDFPRAVLGLIAMGSLANTDPALGKEIFTKMSSIPPSVGINSLDGLLRWDMDEALGATRVPITALAVASLLDPLAVQRYGERITFRAHELGSHHFLIERPKETAELLLALRLSTLPGVQAAKTRSPISAAAAITSRESSTSCAGS